MRAIMTIGFLGLALLSTCLPGPARAQTSPVDAFDHAGLARQVLERHIRPGYAHLATTMRALDTAVAAHCPAPTAASRKAVDTAFDAAVTAWGRVEHIAFGPMTQHKRMERIMFWPDRSGIGARQVANALRKRDPDVLDADRLAAKSVAMQGLPALDTVLFTKDAPREPEARRHRCAFAAAITTHLARLTQAVADEWTAPDGFSHIWLTAGPTNAHFLKPSETTLALAKAFDLGIEKVREQRLAGPLGLGPQRRPLPAPLSKSGRTMRLLVANVEGLRALYVEGGIQQAIVAANLQAPGADADAKTLARLIASELATARTGLRALRRVRAPFDDGQATQRLIAVGFPLRNARVTAGALLATAAGLPIGFNASDGD